MKAYHYQPNNEERASTVGGRSIIQNLDLTRSNTSSIPSQPNSPGSFYRFPLEIRELIYELYSINEVWIWSVKSDEDHEKAHRAINSSPPNAKPSIVPQSSRNAMFHTCRQAYQEGSSLFYQNNRFTLYSGWMLYRFLGEMQAEHIKIIQDLHVARPFLLRSDGVGSGHVEPRALELYEWFPNLQHLHLAGLGPSSGLIASFFTSPRNRAQLPTRRILLALFRLAAILEQLRTITLTSDVPRHKIAWFTNLGFNTWTFDDTPGWAYWAEAFKRVYQPRRVWRVTETLERVHGPFWPGGPTEIRDARGGRRFIRRAG